MLGGRVMNITSNIVKSSVANHHEVIITYEENNQTKQDVIFIQYQEGLTNEKIIKLAEKEFNEKHKVKENKKTFKDIARKHKGLTVAISVVLVAGVITGVTFGVMAGVKAKKVPDDFDKMHEAYKNYLIKTTSVANYGDLSADEIMNKIVIGTRELPDKTKEPIYSSLEKKTISNVETYFIKDIDYEDGSNRDSWPASTHVSQALNLAITAAVRHDPKIQDIATKMTYYWVFNNYRNTNWWQNELGADNNLGSLGLFVYDDLNPKGQAALRGRLAEASFYYRPSLRTHTGANLFDYADITLKSAIISRNKTEFDIAVDRVEDEIDDTHLEGFQTDGSFFQHGQQVQIGSYGKGVIRLGKVLRTMAESSRDFKVEKMKIIENYILRGLQNMTHKGYVNYSAVSREIARENNLSALSNNFNQFDVYLELDAFTQRKELQTFLDNISGGRANDNGLTYFDKAKMIVVNSDGVYMSFKGTAPYLTNTECVNDENQLGLNLSYGTNTCVMDTGKEYFNIFPVWDFSYIPGTTSINVDEPTSNGNPEDCEFYAKDQRILWMRDVYGDQLYEQQLPEPVEQDPAKDYVYSGTESIEKSIADGVAVLMQRSNHHGENDFTVTCIATPNGMVLLGADLSYDGSKTENPDVEGHFTPNSRKLHTTIDQAFTVDDESLSEDKRSFTKGNVVYTLLDKEGQQINVTNSDIKKGYWGRNRALTTDEKDPTKEGVKYIEGKTTTLSIEHDNNRTNAKYAYSIQSQTKVDAGKLFTLVKNFDNNQKVQEVKLPDIEIPGVGTRKRVVVVAYEDIENYLTSLGKTIESLPKGQYQVVTVDVKEQL